ncbi:MAG: Universal stress protein [Labilithrix sp.]|nr:Universal stress protein [Labilithrix sp.]
MDPIHHILVPTDFSEPSNRALALGLELARAFDSPLTLLHVWSMPNTGYAGALSWPIDEMVCVARTALDDTYYATVKVHPNTDAVLVEGNKEWKEILDVAKAWDCDLIVMGTHGRRGVPRFVLGSVAEKLVRLSPIPVVTVGMPRE